MRRYGGIGIASRVYFSAELPLPFPCPATVPPRESAPTRHSDRSPVKPPASSRPLVQA